MERSEIMSITFYDQNNPAKYNDDGDQIGGGIEVNFANGNAYTVLSLMGLCGKDNPDLCGEMNGHDFRKCAYRALATLDMINDESRFNVDPIDVAYAKERIKRLLTVFADAETVCWG